MIFTASLFSLTLSLYLQVVRSHSIRTKEAIIRKSLLVQIMIATCSALLGGLGAIGCVNPLVVVVVV
jgi:hypothetical protein